MTRYVLKRLIYAVFVIFCVVTIVFFLTRLSGDPARLMAAPDASDEEILELREALGLNKPLIVQYGEYLVRAVQGDFGMSYRHGEPAMQLVLDRLPMTMRLSGMALLIALLVALPLGLIAAVYRDSILDQAAMTLSLFGQSFPTFWMGIMLILIFSETLRWLPTSGTGGIEYMILPAVTLSFQTTANVTMLLRSSMLEVLGTDYIRTARAKGVQERGVIVAHALRNAALPVITAISLQIGPMLGGAVVTETVFAYPGMGRLAVQAINNRDFTVVQAFVVVMAVIIVSINLITDLIYTVVDPRIKLK
ncbi:MAG: ABC transporter permease [Christensenellaceae bacterium]|nr:ABC transporter permease [Christensenellaceae bacterium]